jgi:DNA repair protein RadC
MSDSGGAELDDKTNDGADDKVGHRARLRARMLSAGPEAFQDYELIEYALFFAYPRGDTKPIAKALLSKFGSMPAVLHASPEQLQAAGLTESAAVSLKFMAACAVRMLQREVMNRPVLGSWQAVLDYLTADMAHIIHERFRVLYLNNKNFLVHDAILSEGTVNQAAVYVREIIHQALNLGATAIILVHNHPSGDPQPSRDDIAMTKDIVEAGRRVAVTVHDHVIIGRNGYASFKSLGLI